MTNAEITDAQQLRSVYRMPSAIAVDKVIDHVDAAAAAFIAASPLAVLASSDGQRQDASPRGGPAGFVRVISDRRIAFGDLTGNNRLDTYSNLVEHPAIGILMLVPGMEETLRINGRAALSTDDAIREQCAIDGKVPKVAVVIDIDECYLQCGAALRRAKVWDTDSWPSAESRPTAGAIFAAHLDTDIPPEVIDGGLQAYYANDVWNVGGE